AKEGEVFQIRGADAQEVSDSLRIWTGDVTVSIFDDRSTIEAERRAAARLVSPNGLGAAQPGDPLPPVSVECSSD
ncbi:MAG: hypothetical protein WBD55_04560, partial [Dehalococcoidia bacterium]